MTPTPPPPYTIGIELTKAETIWIAENTAEAKKLGYPENYILRILKKRYPQTVAQAVREAVIEIDQQINQKPRKTPKPYIGNTDGTIFADRPAYEKYWLPELYEVYLRRIAPVCTVKQAAELMKKRGYLTRLGKPYAKNYLYGWARRVGIEFKKKASALSVKVDKRNEKYKAIIDSLPPGLTSGQAKRYFSEAGVLLTQPGVINVCKRHGYELKRIFIKVDQ